MGVSGLRQGNKAGKMPHKRAKAVGKLLFFDNKTTPRSIDRFGIIWDEKYNIVSVYHNRLSLRKRREDLFFVKRNNRKLFAISEK